MWNQWKHCNKQRALSAAVAVGLLAVASCVPAADYDKEKFSDKVSQTILPINYDQAFCETLTFAYTVSSRGPSKTLPCHAHCPPTKTSAANLNFCLQNCREYADHCIGYKHTLDAYSVPRMAIWISAAIVIIILAVSVILNIILCFKLYHNLTGRNGARPPVQETHHDNQAKASQQLLSKEQAAETAVKV